MGLDQTLYAKTYIPHEERKHLKLEGAPDNIESAHVEYITEELGYWRKANAIHRWFVENVQEGEDDCKDYWVPREKLEELLQAVETVLEHRSLADTLLPTQAGFFFGSTEYDKWYFEDLMHTRDIIQEALDEKHNGKSIYYGSSW